MKVYYNEAIDNFVLTSGGNTCWSYLPHNKNEIIVSYMFVSKYFIYIGEL